METLIIVIVAVVILFIMFITILTRYKKCPSDRILVIYGKVGKEQSGRSLSAKCIHGGAAFIWPVFQHYEFMSLTPMSITVDLANALSKQNIRIDVPSRFTVGISTETGIMQNAAERLLGLGLTEIEELAKDIIFGQLRLVVATMDIEEINTDRDLFLEEVSRNVESELKKIGLRLINVNVTDINDESGYIDALGKEAAAKAINDARKSVAEKNRDGSIGEAVAQRDERVSVAESNSKAIEGENTARITIANSDAQRREREAEALRRATAAEKVQSAKALEEAYAAEEAAELKRASKEKASREADIIVQAEIEKRKVEIDAEAQAERFRRIAKGEADSIFLKMQAQAKGLNEMLVKQADGFNRIIEAADGDTNAAVRMMIADKMEDIIKVQVEAIKNLKIDKVTVWDSGTEGGKSSTANFLSGLMKSLPPMNELFDMAGMELPEYLGKDKERELQKQMQAAKQAKEEASSATQKPAEAEPEKAE